MFGILSIANIISIIAYIIFGKNHPSSLTLRIKQQNRESV